MHRKNCKLFSMFGDILQQLRYSDARLVDEWALGETTENGTAIIPDNIVIDFTLNKWNLLTLP